MFNPLLLLTAFEGFVTNSLARAFVLALMTTKASAVLSVHSSSLVSSFCLDTKFEENDVEVDKDLLQLFDMVQVSTPAVEGVAPLFLALSIVVVLAVGLPVDIGLSFAESNMSDSITNQQFHTKDCF